MAFGMNKGNMASHNDGWDLNAKYNLPFKKHGDVYSNGKTWVATWVGRDAYRLDVHDNTVLSSGHATTHSAITNCVAYPVVNVSSTSSLINAKMMQSVLAGNNLPHLGIHIPSEEEINEIKELEKLLEQHKKQIRKEKFKQLPKHIRQDIVDSLVFNDLIENFNEVADSSFPHNDKLKALKAKQSNYYSAYSSFNVMDMAYIQHMDYTSIRYGKIMKYLTKDEILQLHADASLEDEL